MLPCKLQKPRCMSVCNPPRCSLAFPHQPARPTPLGPSALAYSRINTLPVELVVKHGHRETVAPVVERSPLGVDDHVLARMLAAALELANLLLAELLDRARLVDVRAVGAGAEDRADEGRAVLVRAGEEGADGLQSATSAKGASCACARVSSMARLRDARSSTVKECP